LIVEERIALLNCRKKNLNNGFVVVSLYFSAHDAIADKQESIRRWLAHEADSVKQGGA
jgi:hypothetical protein